MAGEVVDGARVTVEPEAGSWKITGLEVLDEARIDPGAELVGS